MITRSKCQNKVPIRGVYRLPKNITHPIQIRATAAPFSMIL
jgi:hypothetical protein